MISKLLHFSLSHRLLTIALAIGVMIYGVLTLQQTPIDVFPDLNRPSVTLMLEAPGLAPEEVETLIIYPVEEAIKGIPGISNLRTTSGIGLGIVNIEFDWGSDIYLNRQLVTERLTQLSDKLPRGVEPVMSPISSLMGEIQLIGLMIKDESYSPIDARSFADWNIRPRLLSIPGISQVTTMGGGVKQYQILLKPLQLQRLQISIADLEEVLSKVSQNTGGGFLEDKEKEILIRTIGTVATLEDIENTVVGVHLGRTVLVKDIADVKVGAQIKRGDASIDGNPAIILSIQKQPQTETLRLTKEIEATLEDIRKTLPSQLELRTDLFKQANFIETAVENVSEALLTGSFFIFVVLFIFLANFRTTIITLTAIPVSLMMTLIVFSFFGLSVNTMTLGGLAIAIGELVDDAIVDVENVFRRLRENRALKDPRPALEVVFLASSEIRNSIVFATIIVVLVFIPLFYMDGLEGRLFAPLGISYVVSLLASLIVSLTLTPVLCSFLLNKPSKDEKESPVVTWLKKKQTVLLEATFKNPKPALWGTAILFVASLGLFPFLGLDFLPKFNEGTNTLNVMLIPGVSLEKSNEVGQKIEKTLLAIPEVKSVARRTGRAELDDHAEGVHSADIDIQYHEDGRPRSIVLDEIRDKLSHIDGIFWSLGQPISHRLDHMMSGVEAQIAIKIFGDSLTELRAKAVSVQNTIKNIEGLTDVKIEQQVLIPQLKIFLLKEEMSKYAISSSEIDEILTRGLNGQTVGQVIDGRQIINVILRVDEASKSDVESVENLLVKFMPDGSKVHLSDVADIYIANGPNEILRENSLRRIVVSANSEVAVGRVAQEIEKRLEEVELPEGYFIHVGGEFESQQAASKKMMILGLLSLLSIFVVLHTHFKSTFIALQIMINIPLAMIGSLVALFISGNSLSLASMVAFVTLCGIASRNGIMMISHYLHLMKYEGEVFDMKMVLRGSQERLIPVLMTAATAILGLLPLLLSKDAPGKEILHPVAVVVVGGLLSSTLLDIIITPTVFYLFGRKSAEAHIQLKPLSTDLMNEEMI